jgi:hypothetical protein
VLDAVRHHREYLDGSGYPDALCASSISDLVRILTIADIRSPDRRPALQARDASARGV